MINTMEINPDELAGLDLFQNCRLCLAKEKVSVDIFSDGAEVRLLYYKIISCLPVQVTQEDDKLPKKICMTCNEKVDTFYQFWTLTAKTQKTLIDWAQQKDVITTKIKTENVPPGEMSFKQETIDYSDDNDNDDHYDDDNSDDDVEPSAIVKVCEETDEAGTSATAHIKLEEEKQKESELGGSPTICEFDVTIIKTFGKMLSKNQIKINNSDELRCKICFEPAETETILYLHQRECKKKKIIYKCLYCKKLIEKKAYLRGHIIRLHWADNPCPCCNTTFKRRIQFLKHVQHCNKSKNKTYDCQTCGLTFKTYQQLRTHKRSCEGASMECDACKKIFYEKHLLRKHILNIHMKENHFECDLCRVIFKDKHSLQCHLKRVHILKTRQGEKKFICNICKKAFKTQTILDDHQHVHTGIKKYECHLCGNKFYCKASVDRHIKKVHNKDPSTVGKLVAQCPHCGKSFISNSGYRTHLSKEHGDGKPECKICGKRVFDKKSMEIHMNTHSGYKPYRCEICGGAYTTQAYLQVHLRIHTGETPYKCKICPKSFKQRPSLTGHYRNNHPDHAPV